MLNNITNFFNLIKTGKVKTQLDSTDLLPIGTKDLRFSGQYQPTMIKYGDFISGLVGGSNGQILYNNNDTIAGASNLYWDEPNNRFIIGANTASNVLANTNEFNIQRDGLSVPTGGAQLMFNLVGNGQGMTITNQNGTTYRIGQFTVANMLTIGVVGNSTLNVNNTGNVLIGTTTDSGYKLDVNGTFRASDSLIASPSGGGAYKLTVQHTGVGQGNTFRVIQLGYSMIDVNTTGVSFMPFPSASGTVGITNWTSTGGSGLTFFTKNSEFTPQGGAQALPLIKFPNPSAPIVMGATATVDLRAYLTVSGAFNATSGLASGQQILPTLTATANNDVLVGLDIQPTFTNGAFTGVRNTSLRVNADWQFWGNSTITGVPNIRFNGNTGIHNVLQIAGDSSYFYLWQSSSPTNGMMISSNYDGPGASLRFGTPYVNHMYIMRGTGNVLINTATDAGFRLDVNGTFRVADNNQMGWGNGNYLIANNAASSITLYLQSSVAATFSTSGICTIPVIRTSSGGIAPTTDNAQDLGGQFGRFRHGWIGGQLKVGDATAVNASAKVQIDSTTQGFLPPRMTTTEKNAIVSPAAGLMVYDNTLNRPCFYNGTSWITL